MKTLIWCLWALSRRRSIQRHHERRAQIAAGQLSFIDLLLRMEPSPRLRDYALARRAEIL